MAPKRFTVAAAKNPDWIHDTSINCELTFDILDADMFDEFIDGIFEHMEGDHDSYTLSKGFGKSEDGSKGFLHNHWRDAESVLQHLAAITPQIMSEAGIGHSWNVDDCYVTGPAKDIEILKEPMSAFGARFFITDRRSMISLGGPGKMRNKTEAFSTKKAAGGFLCC